MNWNAGGWTEVCISLISNFDDVAILQEKLVFFAHNCTYLALVQESEKLKEYWREGLTAAAGLVVAPHWWGEPVGDNIHELQLHLVPLHWISNIATGYICWMPASMRPAKSAKHLTSKRILGNVVQSRHIVILQTCHSPSVSHWEWWQLESLLLPAFDSQTIYSYNWELSVV